MLDFTSALYLGLRHPSRSLRPWGSLSTGRPAVLGAPSGAGGVAAKLAALIGCESAVLLPSTLHLFWDLFGLLAQERIAIHMDKGAYAISRWGVERAAARGVPVRQFRHHDPESLSASVRRDAARGLRPVVVADGFCPSCGNLAPLPDYLEIARDYDGLLVLDDTQTLGIQGHTPSWEAPYGYGGGGSLRRFGISGADVLLGSSLAKSFGVPVAVLAGSALWLERFDKHSATPTHCSPPSAAVIHAAEQALEINASHGDALRRTLAQRINQFRSRLRQRGFSAHGKLFPLQTLAAVEGASASELYRRLLDRGVRSVLLHGHSKGAIGFLITASHRAEDIDRAVERLAASLSRGFHPSAMRQFR
ncbi:MAG: aminotransferase class I/II-fold pyridoxal phosphate-dependent enzyme [Gammaproteobacteria bacterium]